MSNTDSNKLNIANEMAVFDRKERDFYDNLTDEERKKFSNYLMIRWGSSVSSDLNYYDKKNGLNTAGPDMQYYYLASCNQKLNKNFYAINRHPKLQWLCATTVSPGMGLHKHQWIAPKKKDSTSDSGTRKELADLFPNYKQDEIELLSQLITKKELAEYVRNHGRETKK